MCVGSESPKCEFYISVKLRQEDFMSPWLCSAYMDDSVREMKALVSGLDARLRLKGIKWSLLASLFADDTVQLAETISQL